MVSFPANQTHSLTVSDNFQLPLSQIRQVNASAVWSLCGQNLLALEFSGQILFLSGLGRWNIALWKGKIKAQLDPHVLWQTRN